MQHQVRQIANPWCTSPLVFESVLRLPVLARFQCGLNKQRVQSCRRSRLLTVAGLQSEMAQEESSRIPLPKVGVCCV